MFPGACGEGLVRSLDDSLGSDVRPAPRGHLTVHREAERLEFVERLPVRPFRDQMRVRDEDPRGVSVGFENGHRLAALHDQGLVVAEALERIDDAVERLPIASRLARPSVDDQLVRLLRVLEVVFQHPEDGLLPPALAPQFRSAGGLDPFHAGDDTP